MTLALHGKSKTHQGWLIAIAVAVVAFATVAGGILGPAVARAVPEENVVYDAIPNPLPPSLPSLGFQATQTAEFGDYVQFDGSGPLASEATVTMVTWAYASTYQADPLYNTDATGWDHSITLNLYSVVTPESTPTLGALIGTRTQAFHIPWRPEPSTECTGNRWYDADSDTCSNGYAFNITFDLSSLSLALPNEIIYGIAYNTNTWGYAPINLHGPYESLNVGLNDTEPTIGTDVELDALFWNTQTAANYTDGGFGGVGTFRRDTEWAPYTPAVKFTASADQCKKDGWKAFDNPAFKNQGDCVRYVKTGK
ncbi:MAG: hypothetical protein IH609_01090 [Dehalococcoidia bacterium]|nr:hypothetical protein [Dehalococcoidia bacterium]